MLTICIRYHGIIYRDYGRFDEVMSRLNPWRGVSLRSFMQSR